MIRSLLETTIEITSLALFTGMIAIWALIMPAVF